MKKGSVQMQQQQNKTNKEKKSSIPKTEQEKDEVDKTKKKQDLKEKLNIEDDPTIDEQVKNPMQESSLSTRMRKTSYIETQTIVKHKKCTTKAQRKYTYENNKRRNTKLKNHHKPQATFISIRILSKSYPQNIY